MQLSPEQKEEFQRRIHRSGTFQRVFRGKDGEFVLNEIDKDSNFAGSTFDSDPYIHAYKAGQRSMAVFIHTIIDQDIEAARKNLEQEKENGETRRM